MKKLEKRNASFENMIQFYLSRKPDQLSTDDIRSVSELEVRFNTHPRERPPLHDRPFNKDGYDAVVRQLFAAGFAPLQGDFRGQQMMRIYVEGLQDVRVELAGSDVIQDYCQSNSLQTLLENPKHGRVVGKEAKEGLAQSSSKGVSKIKITSKGSPKDEEGASVPNVDVDDWRFRVSYKMERDYPLLSVGSLQEGYAAKVVGDWKNVRKTFRYMNRVRFAHPDWPIYADLSIIKMSKRPQYTLQEAGVFSLAPIYEVELEVDNARCGTGSAYAEARALLAVLRKSMKLVFQALQGSAYPVAYTELDEVLREYLLVVHNGVVEEGGRFKDDVDELWETIRGKAKRGEGRYDWTRFFVGPSSRTLQQDNLRALDGSVESEGTVSIQRGYTATDKADGERKMMYIASTGRVYLIDMNMNIAYVGLTVSDKGLGMTLLDGEHILVSRDGSFLNLYAAFDIYYRRGLNCRHLPFVKKEAEAEISSDQFRLHLLSGVCSRLSFSEGLAVENTDCALKVACKTFYGQGAAMNEHFVVVDSIFEACKAVLQRGLTYDYETDGLILTPASMAVAGIPAVYSVMFKTTWEESFKWKPPEFNTVDFLVRTVRDPSGTDKVEYSNRAGKSTAYKTLTLWCGFNPERDMKNVWCSYALEDRFPEKNQEAKKYKPIRFVPSADPYDPEAYFCRVPVVQTSAGRWSMYCTSDDAEAKSESFDENMIVEFRYDLDEPDKLWRWKPIRVRHDKTEQLRLTNNNFGNSYDVANTNWYSIHHPVSEAMLCGKERVSVLLDQDEVYYNRVQDARVRDRMRGLRDFHNKYVKTLLIQCVAQALPPDVRQRGPTLIDLAVGKAGDLMKWTEAGIRFVLGVDVASDNLTNAADGACRRYVEWRAKNRARPFRAVFLHGDSGKNLANGAAFVAPGSHKILQTLCGKSKQVDAKVVLDRFGVAAKGFWITSCQFALHYFFENKKALNEFLRNVSEQTAEGGYFIGTCYDGETVFEKLRGAALPIEERYDHPDTGEPTTMFRIERKFNGNRFEADASSLGYRIDVYQETINKVFPEYLVHFDYLVRLLALYGFDIADAATLRSCGLESPTGMFEDLFAGLQRDAEGGKYMGEYGRALDMSDGEKRISFMNRYFVFRKNRSVDASLVLSHQMSVEDKGSTAAAIAASLLSSSSEEEEGNEANVLSKRLSNVRATAKQGDIEVGESSSSDEEEEEGEEEGPSIQFKQGLTEGMPELDVEVAPGEKRLDLKELPDSPASTRSTEGK